MTGGWTSVGIDPSAPIQRLGTRPCRLNVWTFTVTSAVSTAPAAHRSDIQGLRGLSALLVAVFHLWTSRTAGGVDIFFVVSGYLLIGSLARQYQAGGRVDLVRYGAGILRRLVPTATVVLTVTVLASIALLPVTRWDRSARDALATSVFGENLALIRSAADYLARDEAWTPFRSGWAISAQVQAFVLIAVMMGAVAAIRVAPARRTTVVLSALGLVGLASFAWAVRGVAINPTATYFDSLARLWEFCAGGAAAVLLARRVPSASVRVVLGWTGLVLLLATGWLLGLSRQFPAWAALMPVAAGLLMLTAGARPGPAPGSGVERLLGARPLTWLGDISYGIYLWHGPVVVFALLWLDTARLGLVEGLAVLVAVIALSAATRSLIALRLSGWMGTQPGDRRTWIKGLLLVALGMAVAGGWWGLKSWHETGERRLQAGVNNPGGRSAPGEPVPYGTVVIPRPMLAPLDRPDVYADGCVAVAPDGAVSVCRYGPDDAPVHIAVVGSSHSAHWLPAVQAVAARRGWRVSTFIRPSCLLGIGAFDNRGAPSPACGSWNEGVLARLETERPDGVLTLASFSGGTQDDMPSRTVAAWHRLNRVGIRVLALRDTVWSPVDVPECVARHGAEPAACALPRPTGPLTPPPGGWPDNVTAVDTIDWVCGPRHCPPVIGGVLVYSDRHHLTATFARSLAGRLDPHLTAIVARPGLVPPASTAHHD